MSGDESDHSGGHRRYVVQKLNWRSDEVTAVLRVLDALALVAHWTSDGRPRPGKFPHVRIDSSRVEARDPVRNLPRNFYRAEWLDTLDKDERRELSMGKRVDLHLPNRVLRYVTSSRNRGILISFALDLRIGTRTHQTLNDSHCQRRCNKALYLVMPWSGLVRFTNFSEPWTGPQRTRSKGPVQVQMALNLEPDHILYNLYFNEQEY
jgi:hypothetical protein